MMTSVRNSIYQEMILKHSKQCILKQIGKSRDLGERLHPVHRVITKCIFNGQEHGEGRNHETHHFTEQRDD